jgi:phospholipid/cholesterol/gamma-HCH transport system substrate-binding protein
MLAMKVGNLTSFGEESGYRLNARFDNIGGLKVRSPVKMAGVVIGRVGAIRYDDESYEAVAELTIYDAYKRIPADTTANIYTAGLLGEQYVSLDPGGDDTYLAEGDEISLTQSAVVLEQVIGQFLYNKAAGE